MGPVEGEFPIIKKDATGTFWNVFGEAMNGEQVLLSALSALCLIRYKNWRK